MTREKAGSGRRRRGQQRRPGRVRGALAGHLVEAEEPINVTGVNSMGKYPKDLCMSLFGGGARKGKASRPWWWFGAGEVWKRAYGAAEVDLLAHARPRLHSPCVEHTSFARPLSKNPETPTHGLATPTRDNVWNQKSGLQRCNHPERQEV